MAWRFATRTVALRRRVTRPRNGKRAKPCRSRLSGSPEFASVETPSSDLQEEFAAVHPEQDEPITQENDGAAEEGFKPYARELKEIPTQVDAKGAVQKQIGRASCRERG